VFIPRRRFGKPPNVQIGAKHNTSRKNSTVVCSEQIGNESCISQFCHGFMKPMDWMTRYW
jgi:hypothetical protein